MQLGYKCELQVKQVPVLLVLVVDDPHAVAVFTVYMCCCRCPSWDVHNWNWLFGKGKLYLTWTDVILDFTDTGGCYIRLLIVIFLLKKNPQDFSAFYIHETYIALLLSFLWYCRHYDKSLHLVNNSSSTGIFATLSSWPCLLCSDAFCWQGFIINPICELTCSFKWLLELPLSGERVPSAGWLSLFLWVRRCFIVKNSEDTSSGTFSVLFVQRKN